MSGPYRPGPPPGGSPVPRPGPPPGGLPAARPGPPPGVRPAQPSVEDLDGPGHPAVDAAVQAMINASSLAPADQIAQYEAAYDTLRETLASIDQA
ncbi:hypothetical protein [Micromonospora musae]|uniref:hypothetical protein n=1 Tax=Micromonospora musae TaxID=1894970 RepID=UPI003408E9AF